MDPILVMCSGLGYFFNLYRGQPLVRAGGVLIMSHPTAWEFDPVFHPSYIDFFEQVLAETTDPLEIEAKYEESFATDPWYIHLYRTGHAYHGVHPFYMWYWGAHALDHLGGVIIVGGDRLEALDGPVIFFANHQSHLDTPLLLSALPDRWRHRAVVAAAADYFFDSRLKGTLSALVLGALPVERGRVDRRPLEQARALLDDGWSIVIFPEGGRSPDGWAQPFRGGAAYLSMHGGFPVVPVNLDGTGRVLPKGAKRPTRAAVHARLGAPLRPRDGERTNSFAERIEQAVAVLADERATDWWTARRRAASGTTPALTGPA